MNDAGESNCGGANPRKDDAAGGSIMNAAERLCDFLAERKGDPAVRSLVELFDVIVGDAANRCRFRSTALTIVQYLPRHLLRFVQEFCNYTHLLKCNVDDDEKYFVVLENLVVYATNYFVFLHGLYVTKNTSGANEALTPEDYFGDAVFDTAEERDEIFAKYKIIIKGILDKLFMDKNKIRYL